MDIDAREVKNDIVFYVNSLCDTINLLEQENSCLEFKMDELERENEKLKQKLQGVQA